MPHVELVGVVGGSIGVDPFDRRTWSGLSYYFFSALKKMGSLHRAFGVQPNRFSRYLLMAKTFHPRRRRWRKSFFLERSYREAATKTLAACINEEDLRHPFLQIGAMFSGPQALGGRTSCFSYHDGNLAQSIQNDLSTREASPRKLQIALKYETDLYEGLDGICTTSEYLRSSFVNDFGIPANRVANVGAGVNLDKFPQSKVDKNYDSKQILFIGIDFERKGGWIVLKAFQALRQRYKTATLHIVGPRTLQLPLELSSGVKYHGYLSKGEKSALNILSGIFEQASVFVMPSLYEPFGVAPLEAMANEIPAIVTNRWALKEMVQPGFNGALVEPGDVDDLYEAMARLLKSPEDLARMGRNGRERIIASYTWEHTARRIIDFVAMRRGS